MKTLKTILLSITFISALLLWITRESYLPSLSAFALSDNASWYRLMHLSMTWFFLINAMDFKKYATEFILALGIGLILIFDMYHHPLIHNLATAFTIALACFTLIVNAKSSLKENIAIGLVAIAVIIFLIGYLTNFHLLLAEIIVMALISTGKLIEIHHKL